jgi:hypothetical protein
VVDLNPAGFSASNAYDVFDGVQVGGGTTISEGGHAILWRGSANSFIDLHPSESYLGTFAQCIKGDFQGGVANSYTDPEHRHAVLWRGSAKTIRDLHPPRQKPANAYPYESTEVSGIDCNGYAVGFGVPHPLGVEPRVTHALLWRGSATNYVDLHPSGWYETQALTIVGEIQVGRGSQTKGVIHALTWSGSADSVIDLHQFLPKEMTYSVAKKIDEFGNILGIAGNITQDPDQPQVVVMWVPRRESNVAPGLKIAARCCSAGRIWLQVSGDTSVIYHVERSKDFSNWMDTFQTSIGGGGLSYFDDSQRVVLDPYTFYRVRSAQ